MKKELVLSYSSVTTYEDCPRKWRFRYIDKLPQKPKHFFSFGKSMHSVLEAFHDEAEPPSLEHMMVLLKTSWLSEGYESEEQEARYWGDGVRIVKGYHAKHANDPRTTVHIEYPFKVTFGGVKVRGFIDRVDFIDGGHLHVLDYKTGRALDSGRIDTDRQMTMYQMACEKEMSLRVAKLTLYHIPSLKAHSSRRHNDSAVDELEADVGRAAESIKAGRFDPKSGWTCKWCDYKPLCPIYRKKL